MICRNCGNDFDGRFCIFCGCPAEDLTPPNVPSKPPKGKAPKKKWPWILLIILILAVATCLTVLLLNAMEPAETDTVNTEAHGLCSDGGNHHFRSTTTAAQCTQRGWTANTCVKCGYTYLSDMVSALHHQWGEPVSIKALTCTSDGIQRNTCIRCGLTREDPLIHSGHDYVLTDPISDEELHKEIYSCAICKERLVLEQDELLQPNPEPYIYLPDCPADFSFLVCCEGDEADLRSNLTLTRENELIDYKVRSTAEGVYCVSPVSAYEAYESYCVTLSEFVTFAEYNTSVLKFSILGPERSEVEFNEDNLIFLKALDPSCRYQLDWDETTQRYYLTLSNATIITEDMVGKILAVGEYASTDEILMDGTGSLYFCKLEYIFHDTNGQPLLVLTAPQLSEVYDEFELYFTSVQNTFSQINEAALEEQFMSAMMSSDGFAEYVTAVHLAADSYAEGHGLVVTPLAKTSKDKMKFELTKKNLAPLPNGNGCSLDLEGKITYQIPVTDSNGTSRGSINLTCKAGIVSIISAGGHYEDEESVELYLTNNTISSLSFEVTFKLKYSAELEEKYLVHKNTGTIHTSTCRIATKETSTTNLESLTLNELSERHNGDKASMKAKECKLCRAITGLDGTAYVLNNNTGVLHCMNCIHVRSIKECNLFTIHPETTKNYINCQDCLPQNRQAKDFDNRMFNAMQGSDWGKQLAQVKKSLKDSIGNQKPNSQINSPLSVCFNVAGVFNITISLEPEFEFDMQATANFSISAQTVNTYGIRSVGRGFEPYHSNGDKNDNDKPNCKLELIGEADVKFGVALSVKANPVGFGDCIYIKLSGHIGLYGHFSGAFRIDGVLDDADSFCAARAEAGLYVKVDGSWKILWFDSDFDIIKEKRFPLYKWGYDRVYYAFEEEYRELKVILTESQQDITCNLSSLMRAKYLDLATMKEGSGIISSFGHERYSISVELKNEDGTACRYLEYHAEEGCLHKKAGAPDNMTVYLYVTIQPKVEINSLDDFLASRSEYMTYGYSIDPLVLKVEIETTPPTDAISLDKLAAVNQETDSDSNGGSTLFDLDGTGLSQRNDGKTFNINGNIGVDDTVYTNGFELYLSRQTFTAESVWTSATFVLGGKYKSLVGGIGIIQSENTHDFEIALRFYDGNREIGSWTVTPDNYADIITLNLTGVQYLTIRAEDRKAVCGSTSLALYSMYLQEDTNAPTLGIQIPEDALLYNGHRYKVYANVCNDLIEAEKYCENLGGYLAVITSQKENDSLYAYVTANGFRNVYFGLTDRETEGVWKTIVGDLVTYTNWSYGEPNNESNEDYAMFYWKYEDGTWNDGNFGNGTEGDELVFLCEWDQAQP